MFKTEQPGGTVTLSTRVNTCPCCAGERCKVRGYALLRAARRPAVFSSPEGQHLSVAGGPASSLSYTWGAPVLSNMSTTCTVRCSSLFWKSLRNRRLLSHLDKQPYLRFSVCPQSGWLPCEWTADLLLHKHMIYMSRSVSKH